MNGVGRPSGVSPVQTRQSGAKPWRAADRRDLGHDVARVAGGRADLDAFGAEQPRRLRAAPSIKVAYAAATDLLRGTKMS